MNKTFAIISAAALLALGGCTSIGAYQPEAGETMVKAQFVGFGRLAMCIDQRHYELNIENEGGKRIVRLPTNKRISLLVSQKAIAHRSHAGCDVSLSLVPRPGQEIAIASEIFAARCTMEAVRIDGSQPAGIAPEPSIGRALCTN